MRGIYVVTNLGKEYHILTSNYFLILHAKLLNSKSVVFKQFVSEIMAEHSTLTCSSLNKHSSIEYIINPAYIKNILQICIH